MTVCTLTRSKIKTRSKINLPRRRFLAMAAGAAMLPAVPRTAGAQTYPTKPVRWIVPFAAGGPADILARLFGQWLSERLGQPFIIETRPGAGSNAGTEAAARAAPDGYTLLLATTANAVNASLYDRLNYNFMQDITPVAGLIRVPAVLEVNLAVPVNSVPEFIAYAKANPGKLNMASAGIGTIQHVTGELFNMMTGTKIVHVPYRGQAPALTDLIAGQVQVMFDSITATIGHIRAGAVRALAVTTANRAAALPDLPTMNDFVPGFEASAWYGVGAPANTPPDIVDRLNREINAAFADPKIRDRLSEMGGTVLAGSPAEFGTVIADETDKWSGVVRAANIKPE
jgi:tripartite-type tricarboxylate transporter receptor subunit TctC